MTIKENELIVKIFQKRGPQVQMASLVNSTQHFSKYVIPITRSLLQKAEEERITLNSFYDASVTLIPKQDKKAQQKEPSEADILRKC